MSHQLENSERVLSATHEPSKCVGQYCTIHNMSDHHMRSFPQYWRGDRAIMERICPCGVGHPDPDDPKSKDKYEAIHGCCGCCVPPKTRRDKVTEYSIDRFTYDADVIYDEIASTLVRKQLDYGPNNIAQAPGGPLNGLRVRIFDKISRINNLIDTGVAPENESLRDSFLDLANYGVIGLMVIDGVWPTLDKSGESDGQ